MKRKGKFVSSALASLHEVAEDLHAVGALSASKMEEFDRTCLRDKVSRRAKSPRNKTAKRRACKL